MGRLHTGCPEARLQPTFAAFPPTNFLPSLGLLRSFFDRDGPLLTIVRSTGRTPDPLRFQFARTRWLNPNSRVGLHSHRVTQIALLQFFTKRRHVSITGIRHHDPILQLPSARLVDHL